MALANITNNILTDSGILVTNLTPTSRTITINGVTYDLSADRSWTIAAGLSGSGTANQLAYWDGTSSVTGSATLTYSPTSELLVNNSVTAASGIARGTNLTPTLVAAANGQALVGLDINPTFNNGAFTGVSNIALRVNGIVTSTINFSTQYATTGVASYSHYLELISTSSTNGYVNFRRNGGANGIYAYQLNNGASYFSSNNNTGETSLYTSAGGFFLNFYSGGTEAMRIFSSTRNVLIQNGGTFTDAGFRLDVNGTARVQGAITSFTSSSLFSTLTDSGLSFSRTSTSTLDAGISVPTGLNGARQTLKIDGREGAQIAYNARGRIQVFSAGTTIGLNTTTDTGLAQFTNTVLSIIGDKTASSGNATGVYMNNTLVAAANNDVLVGLDINPTFTNGAFTGVTNYGLRIQADNITSGNHLFITQTRNNTNGNVGVVPVNISVNRVAGTSGNGGNVMNLSYTGETVGLGNVLNINHDAGVGSAIRISSSTNSSAPVISVTKSVVGGQLFTGTITSTDASTTSTGIRIDRIGATISNGTRSHLIEGGFQTSAGIARVIGRITSIIENSTDASYAGGFIFTTSTAGVSNDVMRLFGTGNLALNTTTDAGFKLDVNGTARVQGDTNITGSLGIGTTSLTGLNLRVSKNITGQFINSGGSFGVGILSDGIIQSDEVGGASYYRATINTQAATFTTSSVIGYSVEQGTIGASSVISNQYGFFVGNTLIGATNNYGFFSNIPAAANRWNLYMNGTANNYMAGSLGIGTTALTGYNLRNSKNITGSTLSIGYAAEGTVQSDVTTAQGYRSVIATQATAFTLTNLQHFVAGQGTFGAGSTVTNQFAFYADSGLISAVNNYGFYSAMTVSGTSRWALYMAGTAPNYIASNLGIGTATINASARLQIDSTTQGFLPPRMTTTQKNAIATPATGLVVYDTTLSGIAVYNGTNWQNVLVPNSNNNVLIGTTTDNGQGTLQNTGSAFLGGLQVGGLTFSTSTTATTSTIFYYFNGGSGQTLTLPSTVGISSYFLIKNAGTAALTISRSGSTDTIMAPNGTSTTTTISLAVGSQAILVSNGAFVWIQIV